MRRQKMIMRTAVVSGLLAGMLAALSGCGGDGGGALQLLLQTSFQRLPKTGGPVHIVLSTSDTTTQVQGAEARVTGPGFSRVVALTEPEQRGRSWAGDVDLPANSTSEDQVYTLTGVVQLRSREITTQSTVTVLASFVPPQVQASLNPSEVDFPGGLVDLSVTVTSPLGAAISNVVASVSGPGLPAPKTVILIGTGGTRTGDVPLLPNSADTEATYTVRVEATDSFGQKGQGQATAKVKVAPDNERPPAPP
jgi:hypothetical protein